MDPLLAALGIELAAGTIVDAGKAVASVLLGWAQSDEVSQLFLELDERFGDVPGLSATGLEPLRDDTQFLQLLALFWSTGSFPRDEMVAAIEPHVGRTETQSPREFAEHVADAIDLYSARARESDKELFAIEALRQSLNSQLETLRREIRASPPVVRHITVDWAPPLTRDRLERMLEDGAADVAPLQEALRGHEDPRQTITGLVRHPPVWLASASRRTWEALGDVADGYALWAEAGAAFEHAADQPGADRPMLLARAAANARLAGEDERYQQLLETARALDEDHAQVVLARLQPDAGAEERLELLDAAPVQADPRRQAALDVARAVAHMDKGEWDEAERLLRSVRQNSPDHLGLRELGPALIIGRNRDSAGQGSRVDVAALRSAAADVLALREDLLAAFRYSESGRLLARAVIALAIAGDTDDAGALLDQAREEEKLDRVAATELVEAALAAEKPDVAVAFAPADPQTEREELVAAHAAVFSSDREATASAVETLDRLVNSEDESIRAEAAFARQIAALDDAIDPNADAQAILEEQSPALAALLTAERLHSADEHEEAERLLLPHHDDVRVLRGLVRWAGRQEEWDRVLELSRAITAKEPAPLDRLIFADALYRAGERQEAIAELRALRHDEAVPRDIRSDAYAYSARIASDEFDFPSLERITGEWLELDQSEKRAAWSRVHALLRLTRSAEAIQVVERFNLEPERLDQAELLAAVLEDGGEPETAARRTAELSDQFGRPERLEAQFLIAALRVRPEDRLDDLREQLQERLAAFPERFPESKLIRSVPIDTSSPEGIDAFFREHIEPGAEHVHRVGEQIRRGEAPLAALAAVLGKPASLVTLQLERALPLGFGDPVLDALEQESATQAVSRAVVWDPISLAVVASLPREISEILRLAFPASVTAQATIDDLNRASDSPAADREEYSVIGYDAASRQRFMRDRPVEEIARERDAVARAVEIAQSLQVRPDVDPARPTDIDAFLRDEDREPAFVTWPAALALAQREQKPLYSDDRHVRVQARRSGISSFGTLAALEALLARRMITDERRLSARSHLRRSGAQGVGATLEELLAEARTTEWLLAEGVAFALLDPTAWSQNAADLFRMWAAFLRVAFAEAPDRFETWVYRFLDTAKRNMAGRSYGFLAQSLLLVAWQPFHPQARPFLQTLINALRDGRRIFGWYEDPVQAAAQRLADMSRSQQEQLQGVLARAFLQDVDLADQLHLMGIARPWRADV